MSQCHGSVVWGQCSGVNGFVSVVPSQGLVSWVSVMGQCQGSEPGVIVRGQYWDFEYSFFQCVLNLNIFIKLDLALSPIR